VGSVRYFKPTLFQAEQTFFALTQPPQLGLSSILRAEQEEAVKNPRRPDLSKGEPYKWADVKQPIEPDSRPNSSLERQASGVGKSILKQKAGAKDVLHVVDLKNIPPESKVLFDQPLAFELSEVKAPSIRP
jgi:hypothetical protein